MQDVATAAATEPVRLVHRALGRFRLIALLEGVSYLLLLFVAMPLKYIAGVPEAVRMVGLAHGLLFMAFMAALLHVAMMAGWPARRVVYALVASVVPFGTFALDRRLREEQLALGL